MKSFYLSIALCLAGSASYGVDVNSSLEKLSGNDSARGTGREELKNAFAAVTAPSADSSDLASMQGAVIAALKSGSLPLSEKLYLLRVLELYGTAASADAVYPFLGDENKELRDSARRALVLIPGDQALAHLVAGLKSGSDAERADYVDALGERGDVSVVGELSTYLSSKDSALVREVCLALGKLGSEEAIPPLLAAYGNTSADLKFDYERALLDIGLDSSTAYKLSANGSSSVIRAGAFAQLLELKESSALKVLKAVLDQSEFGGRSLFFEAAMNSSSSAARDAVVAYLPKAEEADKAIIITSIGENYYKQYESDVLAHINDSSWLLRMDVIYTLGNIGGDASIEPLLEAFSKEPKNETIANAVARVQAPSADSKALEQVRNGNDPAARIASMKVLELRNTKGATELLNQIAQQSGDSKVREAAFKTLENIGNIETVQLFIDLIYEGGPLARSAQRSLKRLSLNFGAPDFQWESVYLPSLKNAPSSDARESIVLILDGVESKLTLAYLEQHIMDQNSALRDASLRTLQRWSNMDSGDTWVKIAAQAGAPASDIASAQRSIIKILKSTDWQSAWKRVDLAVKAIKQAPNVDYKKAILEVYQSPPNPQKRHVKNKFKAIEDDPDVGATVKQIMESV